MTRSGGVREGPGGARGTQRLRGPRDPYGIAPVADWVAPILAVVGLVLVGWFTYGLLTGGLPLPGGANNPGGGPIGGGNRTPAPSGVVIVDPRANVPGSLVYVKGGNVWVQTGTTARQLTTTGTASQPAWAPDGASIYYIETEEEAGLFPAQGSDRRYRMQVPSLMRIAADGSGAPERLTSGLVRSGRYTWFHWLRQPTPAPDGTTIAILSDGPDPTTSNVVVQLYDTETGRFSRPSIPENAPLGHQDPAWRPDGRQLLVVQNGRDGSRGAPKIVRWNPETGRTFNFTGPGYLAPAWSRDRHWVAATKTTNLGTDVVILDAATGSEVFRVTSDGRSSAPVWSPMGDALAYLHEDGGIVDLRLARLAGTAPSWQVSETINLTEVSGLDALSRPGWFVPPEQLPPPPTAPPSSAPSAGGSGSSGPSGAPASP